MAAFIQLTVAPATQDQYDALDDRVGQRMTEAGGPPDGLMSHVAYAEGDGFAIAQVWRDETTGREYVDAVLQDLMSDLGLTVHEITARPVWSFARP